MSRFISTTLCALFVCAVSSAEVSAAGTAAGKALYDANCAACHKTGLMGAPKLGDKANWAPRIKQGNALLVSHSIKGFKGKVGMMPAKGGKATLTDKEVTTAVTYMIDNAK